MAENGAGLRQTLTDKARRDCPSCGTTDQWIHPEFPTVVVPFLVDDRVNPGAGIEALVLICGHCGFLRLHSVLALQGEL